MGEGQPNDLHRITKGLVKMLERISLASGPIKERLKSKFVKILVYGMSVLLCGLN